MQLVLLIACLVGTAAGFRFFGFFPRPIYRPIPVPQPIPRPNPQPNPQPIPKPNPQPVATRPVLSGPIAPRPVPSGPIAARPGVGGSVTAVSGIAVPLGQPTLGGKRPVAGPLTPKPFTPQPWTPKSSAGKQSKTTKAVLKTLKDLAKTAADILKEFLEGLSDVDVDVGDAVSDIQDYTENYLKSKGVTVPDADIRTVIKEFADKLNITTSVSDILNATSSKGNNHLDEILKLLTSLADRAQDLDTAGQSADVVLAAIEAIASVARRIAKIDNVVSPAA